MTENTIEHLQAAAQMGVDVALGRLTYIRAGDSPVAPLLALMAHRDEVAPHLLAVLACLPAEIEQREEERPDDASMYWLHSLALYLAGHFEMPEAWPPRGLVLLCRYGPDGVASGGPPRPAEPNQSNEAGG